MPRLLRELLSVYCAPEGEEGGGGGTAPAADDLNPYAGLDDGQKGALTELGVNQQDYNQMREQDREALLADTPDDEHPLEEVHAPAAAPAAAPAVAPAAAPAPTAAPVAPPAPAPAAQAPAAAPAAAPAPAEDTAPPAPAPVSSWRALPDPLAEGLSEPAPVPIIVKADDPAKKDETKTQLEDLFDKFASGELTKEEYQQQKRPLEAQLEEINGRIAAQTAANATYNAAESQNWQSVIAKSFELAKTQTGIDYTDPTNKPLADQLDAAVRRFGQAAVYMHPKASSGWRDRWALMEAHKEVAASQGKSFTAPGAASTPAPPAPAPAGRKAPDLSRLPPTVAGAPAAADATVAADEFAALDALAPADAEREVARFDDAKLARYLAR